MNIESLGRQAIDRIKSEWGLPLHGFVAGGAIANIVWELVSGNKAVVNDIDIFVFDGIEKELDNDKKSLFNYQEKETKYYEDYNGMNFNNYTKDFYSIVESERDDMFNTIKYKSNTSDPSLIIKSFDINATRIGYDIDNDKLYWTSEFEDFLKTGELKISNIMTPSHTAVRIAKKSKELNAKLYDFEFKLLQYALSYRFIDRIKLRFRERYLEMCKDNKDLLSPYFQMSRDLEAEEYVFTKVGEKVELYYLVARDIKKEVTEVPLTDNFEKIVYSNLPQIFEDDNINKIFKSTDFLFYMRNIYGKDQNLKDMWSKLYYFFNDVHYIDREVSQEDLDLLQRFGKYAPGSIENLKGLKMSEQIEVIKKFLDKFKEDPIIAISILESVKVDKDIILDEQTMLLLELSVRKKIVNDTRGKVNKILNIEEVIDKNNNDIWMF
jgi:hypothetical protein